MWFPAMWGGFIDPADARRREELARQNRRRRLRADMAFLERELRHWVWLTQLPPREEALAPALARPYPSPRRSGNTSTWIMLHACEADAVRQLFLLEWVRAHREHARLAPAQGGGAPEHEQSPDAGGLWF